MEGNTDIKISYCNVYFAVAAIERYREQLHLSVHPSGSHNYWPSYWITLKTLSIVYLWWLSEMNTKIAMPPLHECIHHLYRMKYIYLNASMYKVWCNTGTLLILIYNYYITQNHCQPTRVCMPYNTYVNGRGGFNLS